MKFYKVVCHAGFTVIASGQNETVAAVKADVCWSGTEDQQDKIDELGYDEYVKSCFDEYQPEEITKLDVLYFVHQVLDGNTDITILL